MARAGTQGGPASFAVRIRAGSRAFEEAERLFAGDAGRIASATPYAAAVQYLHPDYWWLRTPPGGLEEYAAYVSDLGALHTGGHHALYSLGVRPCLRLNLSGATVSREDGASAYTLAFGE